MHLAAECGHAPCVSLLIEHGGDVNALDMAKRTPLHKALYGEHFDCMTALVHAGADAQACDYRQRNAYEFALLGDVLYSSKRGLTVRLPCLQGLLRRKLAADRLCCHVRPDQCQFRALRS